MHLTETIPAISIPHSEFVEHQLVLTRLPDASKLGKLVPVPGVVVAAGEQVATIKIRNLRGEVEDIVVATGELVAR